MLLAVFATLMLAPSDTIKAQLTVGTEHSGGPAVEWVIRDTALVPLELGKTPYALEFNAAEKPRIICAVKPDGQIRVTLKQVGRSSSMDGTSHCFLIEYRGRRLVLEAIFEPKKKP